MLPLMVCYPGQNGPVVSPLKFWPLIQLRICAARLAATLDGVALFIPGPVMSGIPAAVGKRGYAVRFGAMKAGGGAYGVVPAPCAPGLYPAACP